MAKWLKRPEKETIINLANYDPEAFLFSATTDYPQYPAIFSFACCIDETTWEYYVEPAEVPIVNGVFSYNVTDFVISKLTAGKTVRFYFLVEDLHHSDISPNFDGEGFFDVTATLLSFIEKPADVITINLSGFGDLFRTIVSCDPSKTYWISFSASWWDYNSKIANKWTTIDDSAISLKLTPNDRRHYKESEIEFIPDEHVLLFPFLSQYKNYPIVFYFLLESDIEGEYLEVQSHILTGYNELAPGIYGPDKTDPTEPPIAETSIKNLVGNPVVVEYNGSTSPVTLIVTKTDNSEIIRLNAIPNSARKIRWNIADILEPYITNHAPLINDLTADLFRISPFLYNLKFAINGGIVSTQTNRVAFAGGIPKHLFRKLTEAGTNIFVEKLQKYTSNCFLTTRSAGNKITLPYSEADFIYFIGNNNSHSVVVENTSNNEKYVISVAAGVVVNALSLSTALLGLGVEKGEVAVKIDGNICLTIEIIDSAPSNERYILNFLNSYGVYELVEVTGRAISEPEYAEESIYAIYDPITDSLRNEKLRQETTEVIKVECGYRTRERLLFLRDMLASEDVKMLGADGEWVEVIVSTDGDAIPMLMNEPTSIPLTIKMSDADSRHSSAEQIDSMPQDEYLLATDDGSLVTTNDNYFLSVNK
jgi:hypothetical protein